MRHSPTIPFLLLVAALLWSCGSSGGGETPEDTNEGGKDLIQAEDSPSNSDAEQLLDTPIACSDSLVLELYNAISPIQLEVGTTYNIQARLYDGSKGEAVVGSKVFFILDGQGDAGLSQGFGVTDEYGVATVQLDTGTAAEVEYQLTLQNDCADPVVSTVSVFAHAVGAIDLTINLSQEVPSPDSIKSYDIYLSHESQLCAALNPGSPDSDMARTSVESTQTQVLLEELIVGPGYTAMVVARDSQGLPLAAGCTEGISVFSGKTTQAEVELGPLQVDPSGIFTLEVSGDLSLTGDELALIGDSMTQAVAAAGPSILQEVEDGLLAWVEPEAIEGCLFEEKTVLVQLEESVNAYLTSAGDPVWMASVDFLPALLGDLTGDVEVLGALTLEGGGMGGDCAGTLELLGLTLSAELGCTGPECGTFAITKELAETGEVWLKLDDSAFTCKVTGSKALNIDSFQLYLRPGPLALYGLSNYLLPEFGGQPSFEDSFVEHFDCASMMAGIHDTTLACINRNRNDLIGDCEDGLAKASALFFEGVSGISADQWLEVTGSAELVDQDKDLAADGLEGGMFTGSQVGNGEAGQAVELEFSGTRQN